MCGITALVEPSAPDWLSSTAIEMTRVVRHRGPDGEGLFLASPCDNRAWPMATEETPEAVLRAPFNYCPRANSSPAPRGATIALGHRRLSIVDLSASGHQPMCDVTGHTWITFNGEIYNHLELRGELEALGHRFQSHSDTEVILAAYRQWGEACLPRFNGMWGFVILDLTKRVLFIARDRFGVKPVYLWMTPTGGLAVASEIKQFTRHPGWTATINGQLAYDFVNWGISDHTEECLFKGVTQLRGGHCLTLSVDREGVMPASLNGRTRRWYEFNARPFEGSLEEAGIQFRSLLTDSVRLRLRADVPVGSCLSGGLDSSSIVCVANGLLGDDGRERQNSFSAYSDHAAFDERRFIEEVVRHTGVRPHSVIPNPDDLIRELDQITWHQDEPFGSTSIFAQWSVFRLAREKGVLVMLDGQGADEILGGYHGYFHQRMAGLLLRGRMSALLREGSELSQVHGFGWRTHALALTNIIMPPGMADSLRRIARRTTQMPGHIDIAKLGATPRIPGRELASLRDPVRSLCLAQLFSTNLPMLLHWEDRDSMAHGVESRVPFIDYRLAEFCVGLPEEHKLKGAWTKRVLREGMKGILPETVRLRRDKLGFATAEEVWMKTTHRAQFETLAERAVEQSRGILTPALRRRMQDMLDGRIPFNFSLWRCISLGAWMERFSVKVD